MIVQLYTLQNFDPLCFSVLAASTKTTEIVTPYKKQPLKHPTLLKTNAATKILYFQHRKTPVYELNNL